MVLSNDLISKFVKATKDDTKTKTETTVYGTVVVESDGSKFVRFDGAAENQLTPAIMAVDAENGERVSVLIKDHTATVTGNLSSPAARIETVNVVTDTVKAQNGKISKIEADNVVINETFEAYTARMGEIEADNVEISGKLDAVSADIEELSANTLTVDEADVKYANIDFTNIGAAAIEKIFSDSGIIEDLVMSDGHVTGKLVGVTIVGNLIEGGTVVADKLVILGTDGLYYKLNANGMTIASEQTEYNSLSGTIITAKSITAEKISVDDLVAFGATIGGFNITRNSLYSGVKETVRDTTRGIYLDEQGQFAVGDASNFVMFYKDPDGNYKLAISASSITFGDSGKSVETAINNAQSAASSALSTANNANTKIDSLTIGGRNMLLKSAIEVSGNSYKFATYYPSEVLVEGETYTVSMCITPGTGLKYMNLYASNGYKSQRAVYVNGTGKQVISNTFTLKYDPDRVPVDANDANAAMVFYRFPNDGTVTSNSTIHWVKIEKGNKATDWTPAPEDNINDAVDAINNTLNNLSLGGRNLLLNSRDERSLTRTANTYPNMDYEVSSDLRLLNDTRFVVSFDAKSDVDGNLMYIDFYFRTSDGTVLNVQTNQTLHTSKYARCSLVIDLKAGYTPADIYNFRVRANNGVGTASVKNVKLEVGQIPTAWTPAPEDQVLDAMNTVEVGGRNLAIGSAANYAPDKIGFNAASSSISGVRDYELTTEVYQNMAVARWSGSSTVNYCGPNLKYRDTLGISEDMIVGETYTISMWMKADKATTLRAITSGPTVIAESMSIGTTWTRVWRAFRATSPTITFCLYTTPSATADAPYIYMCGVKFEKGNRPTDWTPAPEDVEVEIDNASKTAKNFMEFDATNGLQVGNKSSGSWSGFRSQIKSTAFNILNAAGAVVASYGEKLIELGKNATDAVIKLCGGKGRIEYVTDGGDDYIQMYANKVRIKSDEMSSVYSMYTDESTRWEKSAVNVSPNEVEIYASECIDPSLPEHVDGWNITRIGVRSGRVVVETPGDVTFYCDGIYDKHGKLRSVVRDSSGIWTYSKWSDGTVDLWGVYTVLDQACTTALGSMYRTPVFHPDDFPFLVYNPRLTASYESQGYGAMLWATTLTTVSKPPSYYLIRPVSGTIASGKIIFHVTGTWE